MKVNASDFRAELACMPTQHSALSVSFHHPANSSRTIALSEFVRLPRCLCFWQYLLPTHETRTFHDSLDSKYWAVVSDDVRPATINLQGCVSVLGLLT
jgi:hypothetical protein